MMLGLPALSASTRSSTPFYRLRSLYTPSWLQVANLALLLTHSLYFFIPSVYLVFLVVFWEGLLGGAVYVNTFADIMEHVPRADAEAAHDSTTAQSKYFMVLLLKHRLTVVRIDRTTSGCWATSAPLTKNVPVAPS